MERSGAPIAGSRSNFSGAARSLQRLDIDEDEEGRNRAQALNDGKPIIPTIIFDDGSILVEPSNAELAARLGISSKATGGIEGIRLAGVGLFRRSVRPPVAAVGAVGAPAVEVDTLSRELEIGREFQALA